MPGRRYAHLYYEYLLKYILFLGLSISKRERFRRWSLEPTFVKVDDQFVLHKLVLSPYFGDFNLQSQFEPQKVQENSAQTSELCSGQLCSLPSLTLDACFVCLFCLVLFRTQPRFNL